MILAKLAAPDKVGQFALGLAVTAPVVMFSNLKLRTVQATDAQKDFAFADYIGHRSLAAVFALAIITTVVLFAGYRMETALVILAVGAAKIVESFSDIFYGLLQSRERMDRVGKSLLIRGPLSLVGIGVGMYVTGSVFWAAVGLFVVWLFTLLVYDIPSGRFLQRLNLQHGNADNLILKPRWEWSTLGRLSWVALPLGVAMMLLSLYTNIPRYFIEHHQGEHALGIFAAMAYIMVAGLTVVHALGQSVTPRLARYYLSGERRAFYGMLVKLAGFGALLGVAGLLVAAWLGREVLILLYSPAYAEHLDVFMWLMAAAGISYVANFLGFGVTATRAFHRQIVPFMIVVLVTLLCSWVLIPEYGLRGAAWALGIANIVNCALFAYVLYSLERNGSTQNAAALEQVIDQPS